MNLKNLLVLTLICFSTQAFSQTNPKLAEKIETLSVKVMSSIQSEDVFLNTGKSLISTANYQSLKKIVMSNGFPTISMVGKENSHKFWMMVQLCDFDIQFQVAVLKQMGRASRNGDIIKEDYAMLTDRTRVNRKLKQLYGTQYFINDFGDVALYPVHDMTNVNERRKSLNLEKIEKVETKVKETLTRKGGNQSGQPNDRPIEN